MNKFAIMIAVLVFSANALAKDAAPTAADPALEKRVNDVASELRCLVCQNQTIADSHAELAVDLKNQVREMMAQGKNEQDVVDYMVQRYGDFVMYRPPIKPTTMLLWFGPLVLFLLGLTVLWLSLRKRRQAISDAPLSDAEHRQAEALLKEIKGGDKP